MATATDRRTDIGPPNYERFLPPVIKANYGKWKYHEILKPGVRAHGGESGDKLVTVRAGPPQMLSTQTFSNLTDLARRTARGHPRCHRRDNVTIVGERIATPLPGLVHAPGKFHGKIHS